MHSTDQTPATTGNSNGDAYAARERELTARIAELEAIDAARRESLDGVSHGTWEYDCATSRVIVSPTWKATFGHDDSAFPSTFDAWASHVHPDDVGPGRWNLNRRFDDGQREYRSVYRFRLGDGSYRWIASNGKVMTRSASGAPLIVYGTHTDVSDWKRAEQALKESTARQREAQRIAGIGSWEMDPATGAIGWSDEMYRVFGVERENFPDTVGAVLRLLHPDDAPRLKGWMEALMSTGAHETLQFRVIHSDGSTRHVSGNGTLERDKDGRPMRTYGTALDITERVRADEALRASEARLRQMVESLSVGVWLLDEQGRIEMGNAAAQRIWGGARYVGPDQYGEYKGWWTETGVPLAPHEWGAARAIAKGETSIDEVIDIESFDGKRKTILYSAIPLRDDRGTIRGAIVVNHDITERQQTKRALRESEVRYRQLFEANPQPMWMYDRESLRFLAVNDAAVEHYGYGRDEFLAMTIADIRPAEDVARLRATIAAFSDDTIRQSGVWRHQTKDGTLIDVEVISHKLKYDGRTAMAVLAHDITERRRAQASVRLQAAALNAAANAIVITDRSGMIVWANAAFTTLTGYSTAEVIGRNPRELVKSGEQDAGFYARFWSALNSGRVWQGEITNRRKDGLRYREELTVTPVKDDKDAITHFIAVKRDLTAEHELQARFLQSQKMESVGRLAAGIAHDFNNMLTVINSTADVAMMDLHAEDPLHSDLKDIKDAGARAAALTRQLLAFSRKQIMKSETINLCVLVRGLEHMLNRMFGEDVQLSVLGCDTVGNVHADAGQIEQVVLNLAVNAKDAMPMGGKLEIAVRNVDLDDAFAATHPSVTPGAFVMLIVSDTGIGMDKTTQQRIFEPFFTTKEPGKGTGLGLATVYGIVKQSGGSIWVDSAPGRGTTFSIYLPRLDDAAVPGVGANEVSRVKGTETILLVEDELTLRNLANRILTNAGYTVLPASDGADALRVLGEHRGPVHLMVTDVVMPGMSGQELATRIAATGNDMKVLFTSGYTDDDVLRHGVLAKRAHFLPKPYSVTELADKVRSVLDARS